MNNSMPISFSANDKYHHSSRRKTSLPNHRKCKKYLGAMNNLRIIIVSISVTLAVVVLLSPNTNSAASSSASRTTSTSTTATATTAIRPYQGHDISLNGTINYYDNRTDFIYQLPSSTSSKPVVVVATALLFHGCRHSASNFFSCFNTNYDHHTNDLCHPLPEETRITRALLARNFAVVAVQSSSGSCWRSYSSGNGDDYDGVSRALKHIQQTYINVDFDNIPIVAVGISSGGKFATSLLQLPRLQAVHAIVSPSFNAAQRSVHGMAYAFTHMGQRDDRIARDIADDVAILRTKGTPVLTFMAPIHSVTAEFIEDGLRSFKMGEGVGEKVVKRLKDGGFLDEKGQLIEDPRKSKWRSAMTGLEKEVGEKDDDIFKAGRSALEETLNRAYGMHEATADHFDEVLDFFEDVIKTKT